MTNFIDAQGPESGGVNENGEFPVWTVCECDEDGDPVGTVYTCHSRGAAQRLAEKMADDRDLVLNDETMGA